MEQIHIQNEQLDVRIKRKGAELASVRDKASGFEFMWQAADIWPRHAPNLFPVIGSLLDHEYIHNGRTYSLRHHGFARDHVFTLLQQAQHAATFLLEPNSETRAEYPFQFSLLISYVLCENVLEQRFRVINRGDDPMPFSIGGHPAFNVRGQANYRLRFSEPEAASSMRLQGLYISNEQIDLMDGGEIPLSPKIFEHDALMFKGLRSSSVRLEHTVSRHAIELGIAQWPYLGIWAKPGADFVCIEPWEGLADRIGHDKVLVNKEGIRLLQGGETYRNQFQMKFIAP